MGGEEETVNQMKAFFKEALVYNHDTNQQFARLLTENQGLERAHELFGHILSAHHIWNARLQAVTPQFAVWQNFSAGDYAVVDKENYGASISILDNVDLEAIIAYKTTKGDAFKNRVRDVLFHVINHSTYHRAQIASEFKRAGLGVPASDWIMYKRNLKG